MSTVCPDRKGGVAWTTRALHLAAEQSREGKATPPVHRDDAHAVERVIPDKHAGAS
jgi:hypothetical protein